MDVWVVQIAEFISLASSAPMTSLTYLQSLDRVTMRPKNQLGTTIRDLETFIG